MKSFRQPWLRCGLPALSLALSFSVAPAQGTSPQPSRPPQTYMQISGGDVDAAGNFRRLEAAAAGNDLLHVLYLTGTNEERRRLALAGLYSSAQSLSGGAGGTGEFLAEATVGPWIGVGASVQRHYVFVRDAPALPLSLALGDGAFGLTKALPAFNTNTLRNSAPNLFDYYFAFARVDRTIRRLTFAQADVYLHLGDRTGLDPFIRLGAGTSGNKGEHSGMLGLGMRYALGKYLYIACELFGSEYVLRNRFAAVAEGRGHTAIAIGGFRMGMGWRLD